MLISTSVESLVADRFGPGFLTLSVCPERALLTTQNGENFGELEAYVPLFILPEEIVRVDGKECGQIEDEDLRKKCHTTPFVDTAPPASPYTALYRQCFENLGTATEARGDALAARYGKISEAFYKKVDETTSVDALRVAIGTMTGVCAPDCDLAKKAVTTETAAIAKLAATDPELGARKTELEQLTRKVATDCK